MLNHIEDLKEQDKAREIVSHGSSDSPVPNQQDALVWAFCLLLSSVQASFQTAKTKADALEKARSRMTLLINEQKSLQYQVANHGKTLVYYTATGVTKNGHVFHYFGTQPPQSSKGMYDMFNSNWVYKEDVQIHSHRGVTMYVVTGTRGKGDGTTHGLYYGTKPLVTAYKTAGGDKYYELSGLYYRADQIHGNVKHPGYADPTAKTLQKMVDEDRTIGKARDYLTTKINILKQTSQSQEMQINTTTDGEGMIIQQGMKMASLLEQLAAQIGQL